MATKSRWSSLGRRAKAGVLLVCAIVAALVLVGESILRETSTRQLSLVERHVRPLARLSALQTELSTIRALESELLKLKDYFAVANQIATIEEQAESFSQHLKAFSAAQPQSGRDDLFGLEQLWRRYGADLKRVTEAASRMDMVAVERYLTFLTGPRFEAISGQLRRLADEVEARAEVSLAESAESSRKHRHLFLLVSLVGVLCAGIAMTLMVRSVVRRIGRLQRASASVAVGGAYEPPESMGDDELAALGEAFDTMQGRVVARERELRDAFEAVEQRVFERTLDLQRANEELTREAATREEAQAHSRLMSEALEQSPVGLMILDMRGHVVHANRSYLERSGQRLSEVVSQRPRLSASSEASARLFREMWMTVLGGSSWEEEVCSKGAREELIWESMRAVPVRDAEGGMTHALLVREDISLRKAQEEKILFQAQYDSLTRLPNRALASDRLRQLIGAAHRHGHMAVLAFLDLDDFKKVNDTLGHEAGDELLIHAARRLSEVARAEDTVARLGGDEFVVILGEIRKLENAEAMARKIIAAFAMPVEVGGVELVISTSIGLAVYPNDGSEAATLMRNADLAMYEAKMSGRNAYRFFDQSIHDSSVRQMELERLLRRASERDELRLAYQPVWCLRRRRLIGAEVLLRWQCGQHGLLFPDSFINIAERTGLIVPIGEWVMREACRQLAAWSAMASEPLHMAVNVSPRQFRGDGLAGSVRACLQEYALDAACLHLEVTEGLLIDNPPEVLDILGRLKQLGVRIAMDDFGTGYSSLSYLRQYPFDVLKIDREFVRNLSGREDERALVTAAIRLGKGLELQIVAEGVETADQLDFLFSEDCDSAQGYFLGRPVPAEEFEQRWLLGGEDPFASEPCAATS